MINHTKCICITHPWHADNVKQRMCLEDCSNYLIYGKEDEIENLRLSYNKKCEFDGEMKYDYNF